MCYCELVECSVIVLLFGKLFYVIGWWVGYCFVLVELMDEICKVY